MAYFSVIVDRNAFAFPFINNIRPLAVSDWGPVPHWRLQRPNAYRLLSDIHTITDFFHFLEKSRILQRSEKSL